jgi:O-antigen/teichoic acid export membrane protein
VEAADPTHPADDLAREIELAVEQITDDDSKTPSPSGGDGGSFSRVVARLTSVNLVIIVAGLITGPVTARALGVEGRGDLAAITAILTVGPWLLDLGLSVWLGRERARGVSREELLGAALPAAVACSLVGVAAAVPLSHVLGNGRPVVTTFLQIGLFLMPISVVLQTLAGLAIGESRWGLIIANRVAGSVLPAFAIVALAVIGQLTVATAAAAYLLGALLGALLFLRAVDGMQRLVFDRARTAAAIRFGLRSWLSTVALTANSRLDLVLMAALVSSRELGLYAIAVTSASVTYGLIGAVSTALFPRVAEGDREIAARSSRITMTLVAFVGAALAVISPWLIPFVFGAPFADAVTMFVILQIATVPMAGAFVLSSALSAANNPAATMRAELVALVFAVPSLILFLPDYGGLLAAVVSLVAYVIRLLVQLRPARRAFSASYRSFLLPSPADAVWLRDLILRNVR